MTNRKHKLVGGWSIVWSMLVLLAQPAHCLASEAKDRWQEEILLQLAELRKSQGELKQQVAELRTEVQSLRSAESKGGGDALDLSNPLYPSQGAASAQIAIVEFSDFECPYCRRHKQATLPALQEKYVASGKVRYFFLDFPLDFHARAEGAAIAAACAHKQGQFWKMHDQLFENQGKLGDKLYRDTASTLGLNKERFDACLSDPAVKAATREGMVLGERLGIRGTPAFVIGRLKNGVLTDLQPISGARPIADFERALSRYLPKP